jgi:alpha-glucosidase (family GH31 glycosyl hydrolase)
MGGQPLAQRLHDKPCVWGFGGLDSLIPEGIAKGLIGHPFNCPDMIGGGDLSAFSAERPLDQELFVRFAQCSALFPMMQFSLAPWRVLDERHLAAVRAAVELRQSLQPEIMSLVRHAARTGVPIVRALAYHWPGYEEIHDQFLLGETIMVAPVLEAGARVRAVTMPPGRWRDASGIEVDGPAEIALEVTLESLPWWRRVQ